jgi:hypothetical protein
MLDSNQAQILVSSIVRIGFASEHTVSDGQPRRTIERVETAFRWTIDPEIGTRTNRNTDTNFNDVATNYAMMDPRIRIRPVHICL